MSKNLKDVEKLIKQAEAQSDKRVRIPVVPGLYCQINLGGSKSFVTRYRMKGAKNQTDLTHRNPGGETLTLKEAISLHRKIMVQVEEGIDPKPSSSQQALDTTPTFGEIADLYFKQDGVKRRLKPSSLKDYQGRYNLWVKESLSHVKLNQIDDLRVVRLIARVNDLAGKDSNNRGNGERTASIVFTVIRNIFKFAAQRGEISRNDNPVKNCTHSDLGVQQQHDLDHRVLDTEEIKAVWHMLDVYRDAGKTSGIGTACCKIHILTGLRTQEIIEMQWSELEPLYHPDSSANGAIYHVPASRMKNGKPHQVYLSNFALSLFNPYRDDTDFVFPSPKHKGERAGYGTAGSGFDRLFGLRHRGKVIQRLHFEHFSPHDVRRSFATGLRRELKAAKSVIHGMIAHTAGDKDIDTVLDRIYIKEELFDDHAMMWQRWSDYVEDLIAGKIPAAPKTSIYKSKRKEVA